MYNNRKSFGDNMVESKITVTLAGKYRGPYFDRIKMLKNELIENGIDVLYPPSGDMSDDSYGFFDSDKRTGDDKKDFRTAELSFVHKTFLECDAIIFCNFDGYLGKMTTNELYLFSSLIACNYYEKQNSNYNILNGYIPIYLLEEVNIESFRTPDELGDFATLLEYGMEKSLIKIGLKSFYEDFQSGQITKMKKKW